MPEVVTDRTMSPRRPALLEQVHGEERHHLQLVDVSARLVNDADAVRVSVIGDTEVERTRSHALHRLGHVAIDRLGMHTAEPRVALAVQLLNSGLPTQESSGDEPGAGAVHGLVEHAQAVAAQRVEIDHAAELHEEIRQWVDQLQATGRSRLLVGHLGDATLERGGRVTFDLGDDLGGC